MKSFRVRISVYDVLAVVGTAVYGLYHAWAAMQMHVPIWDGAVYMLNAGNLLHAQPPYEFFRPFVLPVLIALTWIFTGVNYQIPEIIQALFTAGAGLILYDLVLRYRGKIFALVTMLLFLLASPVLTWTDYLLPHGISVFFVLSAIWCLEKGTTRGWMLGGLFSSLAVLARYPTAIIVVPILFVYALVSRKVFDLNFYALGAVIPLAPLYIYDPPLVVGVVERNTFVWSQIASLNQFFAAPPPVEPAYFYLEQLLTLFVAILPFLLLALASASTYRDKFGRLFAVWFLVSLAAYSLIPNKNPRFMFEWMPALAFLTVEGLSKVSKPLLTHIMLAKTGMRSVFSPRVIAASLALVLIISMIPLSVATQINYYQQNYAQNSNLQNSLSDLTTVAKYVKEVTSPETVIVSDTQAPLLALYSGRTVYSLAWDIPIDKMQLLLSNGAGPGSTSPSLVLIFPTVSGYDPNALSQQGFFQLKDSFFVSPALGTVYIFSFNG